MSKGSQDSLDLFINLIAELSGGKLAEDQIKVLKDKWAELNKVAGALGESGQERGMRTLEGAVRGLSSALGDTHMRPDALMQVGSSLIFMVGGFSGLSALQLTAIGGGLAAMGAGFAEIEKHAQEAAKQAKQALDEFEKNQDRYKSLQDLLKEGRLPGAKEKAAEEHELRDNIEKQQKVIDELTRQKTGRELQFGEHPGEESDQYKKILSDLGLAQQEMARLRQQLGVVSATATREEAEAIDKTAARKAKSLEDDIRNEKDVVDNRKKIRDAAVGADQITKEQAAQQQAADDQEAYETELKTRQDLLAVYQKQEADLRKIGATELAEDAKQKASDQLAAVTKLEQDHDTAQQVAKLDAIRARNEAEKKGLEEARRDMEEAERTGKEAVEDREKALRAEEEKEQRISRDRSRPMAEREAAAGRAAQLGAEIAILTGKSSEVVAAELGLVKENLQEAMEKILNSSMELNQSVRLLSDRVTEVERHSKTTRQYVENHGRNL